MKEQVQNPGRLSELRKSVLQSVYDYCKAHYDKTTENVSTNTVFTHKNHLLGVVEFEISVGVLEIGSIMNGNDNTPDSIEFRLDRIIVEPLFGTKSGILFNVTDALNELLKENINQVIAI